MAAQHHIQAGYPALAPCVCSNLVTGYVCFSQPSPPKPLGVLGRCTPLFASPLPLHASSPWRGMAAVFA